MSHSNAPEGYCQCGCGSWLGFWEENDATCGRVKGAPKLWARGHNNKRHLDVTPEQYREEWETAVPHIPYGRCWCGCGQKTRVARYSQSSNGRLQGEPLRYVNGHQQRGPSRPPRYAHGFGWIPLSQGRYALVDTEDAEWLAQWRWYFWEGYARRNAFDATEDGGVKRRPVLMHRIVLGVREGTHVDHANGDGLDNRRRNLRRATRTQNAYNRRPSGDKPYKGVHWNKNMGRWCAAITQDGKRRHLGYFGSEEQAARAYDFAAASLHSQFARLNFPDDLDTARQVVAEHRANTRHVTPQGKREDILRAREERGLTSYELAREFGVSPSTAQRIIRGVSRSAS